MSLLASASAQELSRTISVTGKGTVHAEPDVATLNISIDVKDIDLGKATNEANAVITEVKSTLNFLGVAEEDIRTANFSVWPEQRYDLEGNPSVEGYRVNHVLRVTVNNIEIVGKVVTESINAGANGVNDIQYTFSDSTELERQARVEAMMDARAKAEQLAELAEVSIVGVKSINDQANLVSPVASPRFEIMSSVEQSVPVSAGQLATIVNLAVSFLIE